MGKSVLRGVRLMLLSRPRSSALRLRYVRKSQPIKIQKTLRIRFAKPRDRPTAGFNPSAARRNTWPPSNTPILEGIKKKRLLIMTVSDVIRNATGKVILGSKERSITYVSQAPSIQPVL